MSRSLRPWSVSAALLGLCGLGASVAQAEDSFGYLDLRFGVHTMPLDSFSGGPAVNRYSGDFDTAFRASVTLIGPVCNMIPLGCGFTGQPARSSRSSRSGHEYDDLIELEGVTWHEPSRSGFDLLAGLELSYIYFGHDGEDAEVGPGVPKVDVDTIALSMHLGWGFAANPSSVGILHFELTGFAGLGFSMINWEDVSDDELREDDTTGVYYEIGVRAGMYYTFSPGLQIGVNARWLYANHTMDVFSQTTSLRISGPTLGGELGWRF
ncbi:MAG: hypothetical protein EA401_05560 [Planctomycetota bacterium]|nr:MAG: hypothetical protein EA401_05560 [Planctomycetota bacterium]